MSRLGRTVERKIQIAVCDASRIQCELLADALLRSGGLSVKISTSRPNDAFELISQSQPQVGLISDDLEDGRGSGLRLVERLRTIDCPTRCVVLVERSDREVVVEAFRCGATGIFCRTQSLEMLHRCIVSVANGQIWASSPELHFLLEALAEPTPLRVVDAKGMSLLTEREENVVTLLAEGLTNREIAERLRLTENTIKNYMYHIFDKLGVSNRTELILHALSHRSGMRTSHVTANNPRYESAQH